MLNREFFIPITDRDRFRIRVKTQPDPERPSFMIQLECDFGADNSDWQPVIRADDWQDRPHFDILSPDGTTKKVWQDDLGDNKMNMKACLQKLKEIWLTEKERYENELKLEGRRTPPYGER